MSLDSSLHIYTLCASCPDQVGIIAHVSSFIAQKGGWVMESAFHADNTHKQYFMRIEIRADSLDCSKAEFEEHFQDQVATPLSMDWKISDNAIKKRVVLMVSKQEHCLYDLLSRWRSKELDIEIACVISNHEILRDVVEWHNIPFWHIDFSSTPETAENNKLKANQKIKQLLCDIEPDCIVLARYMQILPADICKAFHGKILNIHHSFLPSFVGAKPYHQAHEKGVKLIGATCHYVTQDLDQGPIIEQDVIRVDHSDSPQEMVRYGKDIEKTVLARGLLYHLEERVQVDGNKTIVFN